jgi:hypothetical protein
VIRARTTQICRIVKNNTLDVPFIFTSAKKSAAYEALLDSGATENFIDPRMVDKLGIGRVPMVNPRTVFNVDGTENQGGQVNHYCILNILQGRKQSAQVFFITNLGNDHLIFGYPWLEEFVPQIDWKNRTILGPPVKLTTMGRSWKIKWANRKLQMNKVSISQQWAEKEGKDQTKVEVPHQFQRHKMVFSEEAAKRFPPSQPEDHVINLREDAPQTINCKTYKLTLDKREAMVFFLKDQQDKEYMAHSNSPWSSPFFYIKKKSGQRRPVYDYREVN